MVTHPTTNLPACGLSTAERTGSPVFHTLWSYVLIRQLIRSFSAKALSTLSAQSQNSRINGHNQELLPSSPTLLCRITPRFKNTRCNGLRASLTYFCSAGRDFNRQWIAIFAGSRVLYNLGGGSGRGGRKGATLLKTHNCGEGSPWGSESVCLRLADGI